jgi:uncharacterized membrane protein
MYGNPPVTGVANAAVALWIALAEKLVEKGHLTRADILATCEAADTALAIEATIQSSIAARRLIAEHVRPVFEGG